MKYQNMYEERKPTSPMVVFLLFLVVMSATFLSCSSVIFQLGGNITQGYHVSTKIGQAPELYDLDIDTGSDVTWVKCDKYSKMFPPAAHPHKFYKFNQDKLVYCKDQPCIDLHGGTPPCAPNDQCNYKIEYADKSFAIGVLVKDSIPDLGSLAFGCGYEQVVRGPSDPPPPKDGVLGLGRGKVSIVSQLRPTLNVFGHCLREQGGFLIFEDKFTSFPGIKKWTPMVSDPSAPSAYLSGPAELRFGQQNAGVKNLYVIFDSGTTYTYFNSQVYEAILSVIRRNFNGKLKQIKRDAQGQELELPVCWKGSRPDHISINDVKKYLTPLELKFPSAQLLLQPEDYLTTTKDGNVCLGVLNGTEVGLGDRNLIGAISLREKIVIYDNKKQQIGWVLNYKDCNLKTARRM